MATFKQNGYTAHNILPGHPPFSNIFLYLNSNNCLKLCTSYAQAFQPPPELHGPIVPRPIIVPTASLTCPLLCFCTMLSHCPLLATADYCATCVTVLVHNHIATPTPQQCTQLHVRYPLHILSFCSARVGDAH
jgi:hypothetical protein